MKKLLLLGLLLIPAADMLAGRNKGRKTPSSTVEQVERALLEQARTLRDKLFPVIEELGEDFDVAVAVLANEQTQVKALKDLLTNAQLIREGILENAGFSKNITSPPSKLQLQILRTTLIDAQTRFDLDPNVIIQYTQYLRQQIINLEFDIEKRALDTSLDELEKMVEQEEQSLVHTKRKEQKKQKKLEKITAEIARKEEQKRICFAKKTKEKRKLDASIQSIKRKDMQIKRATTDTVTASLQWKHLLEKSASDMVVLHNKPEYKETPHEVIFTIITPLKEHGDIHLFLHGMQESPKTKAAVIKFMAELKKKQAKNPDKGLLKKELINLIREFRKQDQYLELSPFRWLSTKIEDAFKYDINCEYADEDFIEIVLNLTQLYLNRIDHSFFPKYKHQDPQGERIKFTLHKCPRLNHPKVDQLAKDLNQTLSTHPGILEAALSKLPTTADAHLGDERIIKITNDIAREYLEIAFRKIYETEKNTAVGRQAKVKFTAIMKHYSGK